MENQDELNLDELNIELKNFVKTDSNGNTRIEHLNYDFFIHELSSYTIDEINELFLKQKYYINLLNKIDKDLQKNVFTDKNGIISIKNKKFELYDISNYSIEDINDKYLVQKILLNNLLTKGNFKQYIFFLPAYSKAYEFKLLTEKPKKGTIEYKEKNGNAKWDLCDKEYWEFSRFLWNKYSYLGCNSRNGYTWFDIFKGRDTGKEFLMTKEERNLFEKLPDTFTIYRGFIQRSKEKYFNVSENKSNNKKNVLSDLRLIMNNGGFSFSLLESIGLNYVDKYKKYNIIDEYNYKCESKLFEIIVNKKNVFAYFNHNAEQEILVIYQNF